MNPFTMEAMYDISNIDQNSCYIDLNYGGNNADIYAIYGTSQTKILKTNIGGNTELWCDFDWFYDHRYKFGLNEANTIFCSNNASIQSNIIDKLATNEIVLKTSNPNLKEISCESDNTNCVLFIPTQYNLNQNVMCPKGEYTCSVIWCVIFKQKRNINWIYSDKKYNI